VNDAQKSKEQLIQELLELRREVATLKNTGRRDCSAPIDFGLDQPLMDSLPHPAMLIRSDRTVLAANLIAQKLGARVGGYCWRDFGRSEFIPEEHKHYINQHNVTMPPGGTKCTFCLSDEAMARNKPANEPEISAFGRLWSTWWVPISNDTYLHYAIDITKQKEIESELKEYRDHLEKLVRERTSELALANEQLKSEIKERGLTEEALRESEARFRSIFEKSLVVKLMVHPETGAILDANPAAAWFYGYEPGKLRSMKIWEINILPRQELEEEMEKAADERRSHFLVKHRLASGEVRDVEVHSSPIYLRGQKLLYSIVIDVTARKLAEDLLEVERDKFSRIADTTDNAVFVIDSQHGIAYLNPVAEKDFGSPGDHKCFEYFHHKNEPCSSCLSPEVFEGSTYRRVWTSPVNLKTYDVYEVPFQLKGTQTAKLVILHDITHHKQTEQSLRLDEARLEALLKLSQMSRASMEEIAEFVVEQLTGLTDSETGVLGFLDETGDALTMQAWWPRERKDCALPEELEASAYDLAGPWHDALRTGKAFINNDFSSPDAPPTAYPDGHAPLSRFIIVPVSDGKRIVAAGAAGNKRTDYNNTDVRQATLLLDGMCELMGRKQAEEALRKSEKKLRHLSSRLLAVQEDDRTRLAREIHDKVGQTLAALKFGVESALTLAGRKETSVPCLESLVPKVQRAIDEVRRLYTDLRPTVLDDFGIIAAMSWCCRELRAHYPGIQVEERIGVEEGDVPNRLKIIIFRVMQEALNNVARHSEASSVLLSLGLVEGSVRLTVEDNGCGFDMNETASVTGRETGVGLASTRERVEISGGFFEVASAPGQGTTLRASWPLQ
jgi:PAS domain S-box-containing protein